MADMMRMICFTITQSQQRAMQLSAAFRYAIFTPKQEELYVSALMQKGYFAEWNYVVVMMDICDRLENEKEEIFYAPILKDRLERFAQKAARVMEQEKHDVVVFTENDRILMVFSDMKEEKAAEFAETVKEQIVPLLKTRNLYLLVLEIPQRVSAVCQKAIRLQEKLWICQKWKTRKIRQERMHPWV